jgi:hypothetical protein
VLVTRSDRATLESWTRAPTTPQRTVIRSRIVLLLADGLSARAVARRLGVSRHTVDLWRSRFLEAGCDVLTRDRPGRGRKPRAACSDGSPGLTTMRAGRSLSPATALSLDHSSVPGEEPPGIWLGQLSGDVSPHEASSAGSGVAKSIFKPPVRA